MKKMRSKFQTEKQRVFSNIRDPPFDSFFLIKLLCFLIYDDFSCMVLLSTALLILIERGGAFKGAFSVSFNSISINNNSLLSDLVFVSLETYQTKVKD